MIEVSWGLTRNIRKALNNNIGVYRAELLAKPTPLDAQIRKVLDAIEIREQQRRSDYGHTYRVTVELPDTIHTRRHGRHVLQRITDVNLGRAGVDGRMADNARYSVDTLIAHIDI